MKKRLLPLLMLSSIAAVPLATASANKGADNASVTKMIIVDRTGKPPFERRLVEVQEHDVAQFELLNASTECENRMSVDMRGKPPFKRSIECIPVIDVAQFETIDDSKNSTNFSGHPPFKRR
ncbi:hypothetical protein ACOJR9_15610 [Alteromonas sp. A081]|jgi:hypothetical protein|uniref:hypothetical protein n=1 Tax=Alteromonas TaxID=226 RepID=UPI0032D994D6